MRAFILCCALVSTVAVSAFASTTAIRPPAVPLLVRSPYLSIWQEAGKLTGSWTTFWNGDPKPMTGIARIDGRPYVFIGAPAHVGPSLAQRSLSITPTQSIYTFYGAGVRLTIDFLSPVDATDLRRLSMPFGYIAATARSVDGRRHDVSLYFDISGRFASGDPTMPVQWRMQTLGSEVRAFAVGSAKPRVLEEYSDEAQWGSAVLAARNVPGMTYEAGPESFVHADVSRAGKLTDRIDRDMPRLMVADTPVFGFNVPLGKVTRRETPPIVFLAGFVRDPAVSYLGKRLPPLWKSYWPTWQQMAAFAFGDFANAKRRADRTDERIMADARRASGEKYAALCALALRQSFGATELVGTAQRPWMFMKEISSDGNVSTVDVVYPSFPVFLYENPRLLGLLLEPLFDYAERGGWPKPFAEHDIGSSYPVASGHNDGKEEDMPVEESANMLLMTDAYVRSIPAAQAQAFAKAHYRVLKQWAGYEAAHSVNPEYQNQTDDFTGFIKSSANLALKGILSVGAMGQLAQTAGYADDAQHYTAEAKQMIAQWQTLAESKSGDHLVLEYGKDATWSLKYNAFPDKLLGLNLLPKPLLHQEAAFYLRQAKPYGIPLDNRHSYTKADWELWTAAAFDDEQLQQGLVDEVYAYANGTTSRSPFPDWYDTVTAESDGFMARPVMGAAFALLVTPAQVNAKGGKK
jgi:hypothetical protein